MTAIAPEPGLSAAAEPATPRALARVLRNPLSAVGLVIVVIAVVVAIAAPLLAPYPPDAVDFTASLQRPSRAHWLGTDKVGRDQLSRVIYGVRVSMTVGFASMLLSVSLGAALGLLAGYFRRLDPVISRITDAVLAFPFLVLAIGLSAILGPSLTTAIIALAVGQMPSAIRVMRSEALRLRGLDYISAAITGGAGDLTIIRRHILPNAASALVVQATVVVPAVVLGEALLSYLGLGVRPPTASLGVMLSMAQPEIARAPWLSIAPGMVIVAIALSFNLLGDGLRDVLDPKRRSR